MEKEMSIFIQTSQVLGCAVLALLESNQRTLNIDEFMYICATVDVVIRKRCNAVLEMYNTKVRDVISMYSNVFRWQGKNDIYIKEVITKKHIEYYFTGSIPKNTKKVICEVFSKKWRKKVTNNEKLYFFKRT